MKKKNSLICLMIMVLCVGIIAIKNNYFNVVNNRDALLGDTTSFVTGDVNNNGSRDSDDYIKIRKYIIGSRSMSDTERAKGDINGDGVINSNDYIILRKAIIGTTSIKEVTSISLNKSSSSLNTGESETLGSTISPSDATNKKVSWSSSNSTVATVDSNGKISAVASGTAVITVTSNNGHTATCTVTVASPSTPIVEPEPADDPEPEPIVEPEPEPADDPEPEPADDPEPEPIVEPEPDDGGDDDSGSSSGYVITEDSKYSSYTNIASYSSDTFKYRLIQYNGKDIVLIWVKDRSKQFNMALAKSNAQGSDSAENILKNEIKNYGYEKKGLVAVNASFFSPVSASGTPKGGVVINKGKIVKNTGESVEGIMGITTSGKIKMYHKDTAENLLNQGIKDTFIGGGQALKDGSSDTTNRTQVCAYDKNNFVILSGSSLTVSGAGQMIVNFTGCKKPWNLDGGGSRKLWYKGSDSSSLTKRFDGGRLIPDMMYFVEQ